MSVMLAILGDPAEVSDRKRGTLTTVLRVCHFMKIVPVALPVLFPHCMVLQNRVTGFLVIL